MFDFDKAREVRATQEAAEAESTRLERQFRIGGEVFVTVPSARPWTLLELAKVKSGTGIETIVTMNNIILSMIEPEGDAHARWQALLERSEDPVTLQDMQDVVQHLIEVQTGRTPTQEPSPSSSGRKRNGTGSTGGSSSRGAKREPVASH